MLDKEIIFHLARFQVFTDVLRRIQVFLGVTPNQLTLFTSRHGIMFQKY